MTNTHIFNFQGGVTMSNKNEIREIWLNSLKNKLQSEVFKPAGLDIPADVKISVGWTSSGSGRSKKHVVLGECFSRSCSANNINEIFISPVKAESLKVADVLAHELIHAIDDCQDGHGPKFRAMALAIGLTGKMTATVAGPELEEKLKAIIDEIGEYPHAELTFEKKKQSARMIKHVCEHDCGAIIYQSRKQSEENPMLCGNCTGAEGYDVYMVQA